MKMHAALARALVGHGVHTIFGVTGDANRPLVERFAENGGDYVAAGGARRARGDRRPLAGAPARRADRRADGDHATATATAWTSSSSWATTPRIPSMPRIAEALGGQGLTVRGLNDMNHVAKAIADRTRPLLIELPSS